ncbi:hypothetical protein, partial [Pseudofulvimonas gallinarii]|uniref:hypothetical protein n=1 Tax=Pseudofulvimonas gallinarii TaxID=634155 RepID=UPI001A9D1EC8
FHRQILFTRSVQESTAFLRPQDGWITGTLATSKARNHPHESAMSPLHVGLDSGGGHWFPNLLTYE